MAVTINKKLFTWGCGKNGQLGHGSAKEDILEPKEVVRLSNLNVV
jgi:alpha-tubulin suppressor-like RCC1 family protein